MPSMISFLPRFLHRKSRGAAFIEALLALPIFILVMLLLIDFGRYFFTYIVVHYAAQNTADYATKIEIESDVSGPGCPAGTGGALCEEAQLYRSRVLGIVAKAVEKASLVASLSPDSSAHLQRYRLYDTATYADGKNALTAGFQPVEGYVAFLRPGERALQIDEAGNPQGVVDHSGRSFGDGQYEGWPSSGQSWAALMEVIPVEVRMDVLFDPVVPFLPEVRIVARQYAFKKSRAFGVAVPQIEEPTATAVPSPTATLAPTNTPLPTNTPTASNTPSQTPTGTVTSTASASRTPTATHTSTATTCPVGVCTATPTTTPTNTRTSTATATHTRTATATPTATATCNIANCVGAPNQANCGLCVATGCGCSGGAVGFLSSCVDACTTEGWMNCGKCVSTYQMTGCYTCPTATATPTSTPSQTPTQTPTATRTPTATPTHTPNNPCVQEPCTSISQPGECVVGAPGNICAQCAGCPSCPCVGATPVVG